MIEDKEIMNTTGFKYKRSLYDWPCIGDSDFGAKYGAIKITIESDYNSMPESDFREILELLNTAFEVKFKTKEMIDEEQQALQRYIDSYEEEQNKNKP